MLIRSMLTSPRLWVADVDVDPSRIARSAGELATHDLPLLVRRADVPRRFETGKDAASDAIRSAVEHIPGRQRRNPWRPWVPGLTIVSVLAVLAIASWWMARNAALSTTREVDRELDEDAVDRATSEGMPAAADVHGPSNGTAKGAAADGLGVAVGA
jgi:hypothetical protein